VRSLLNDALLWYGVRTPYFPGKASTVDWIASHSHQTAFGKVTVERRGVHWELDLRCPIQRSLYYLGWWEVWDTKFLQSLLWPGACVIDVGANCGYYALLAGKTVGPSGLVYAFEPAGEAFKQLVKNIELNDMTWVYAEKQALGDSETVGFISISPPENRLSQGVCLQPGAGTEEIKVTTLDIFARKTNISRLDFLKVDIEGYEPRFLRGASDTIRRFMPLMMIELYPLGLEQHGCQTPDFIAQIESLGYEVFILKRRTLRKWQLAKSPAWCNLIAIPMKRRKRFGV